VLDAADRPLPPGRRGQIAIRPREPYSLFSGYRRNPQGSDENISAEELEAVAGEHPGVMTCAAIGVPGELGDEDVLLYLQPRPGVALDPAEVCRYLAERVAGFMLPS
jgi:crotonobetaine/carnitine-CoA ligase